MLRCLLGCCGQDSRSPTFVVRVRVSEVLATQRHQGQQAQAHALHCVNATCATHVLPFNALDIPSAHAILVFADQLAAVLQQAVAKPHR